MPTDPASNPPPPESTIAERSAFEAWHHRNFRLYAPGFLTSATSLQMLSTGVAWEVWERTRDPFLLGLVGLARAMPVVLLALIAGHAADNYDRRRLLCITQLGFALCAVAIAWASFTSQSYWLLIVLLMLSGCCRAFNGPSRNSLVPLLVPREAFQNAVTWNASVFQFSAIVGPLLAGGIDRLTGYAWPIYIATAVGTATFAFSILFTSPRPQPPAGTSLNARDLLAGAVHIWRERTVFGTILLDLLAVLLGGATALLPIFADDILNAGPVMHGALRASPFVGALLMGLALTRHHDFRKAGPILLWSVFAFGLCMIVFGLSRNAWLSLVALTISGAVDQVSVVVRHVLVQMRTPDHLRGRVAAINSVFIECSNELGSFESGLVAKVFTPVISVVSGGIGTMLVVAGVAWGVPEVRRLDRLHEPDQNEPRAP